MSEQPDLEGAETSTTLDPYYPHTAQEVLWGQNPETKPANDDKEEDR